MARTGSKSVPRGTKKKQARAHAVPRDADWDDLRVLAVVAREGSLGRAARVLRVAKPTIRRRIERLEASAGSPLMDRGGAGVVLTAQGRHLADMAEEMATMVGKVLHRSRPSGEDVQGACKLAMSDGLATTWFVPNFLSAFSQRHPAVVLRLAAAADADKIAIPPFDLQVRYAPAHDDQLYVVRAGTFHFTYFASRRYVERFGLPRTREDPDILNVVRTWQFMPGGTMLDTNAGEAP